MIESPAYDIIKEEGKQEGRLEGKIESAKGMLDAGAELDFVLKATGLSEEDLKKAGLL